jgi:hypothetical protein
MNFLNFILLLWVIFALLDPDPIGIRIRIRNRASKSFGIGSTHKLGQVKTASLLYQCCCKIVKTSWILFFSIPDKSRIQQQHKIGGGVGEGGKKLVVLPFLSLHFTKLYKQVLQKKIESVYNENIFKLKNCYKAHGLNLGSRN